MSRKKQRSARRHDGKAAAKADHMLGPRRFTDRLGRQWTVDVHTTVVERVRRELGFNLLDAFDPHTEVSERLGDPVTLVATLYLVCFEQVQDRDLSDEEFGRGFSGDCLQEAQAALLRSIADFFSSRRRAVCHRLLDLSEQMTATLDHAMEQQLAEVTPDQLTQALQRLQAMRSSESATGSPA